MPPRARSPRYRSNSSELEMATIQSYFRICVAGAVLFAGHANGAGLADEVVVLTRERPPAEHEAIWLKVTVGSLPRGSLLRIMTGDGEQVGTVSPFGGTTGTPQELTLPLPKSATAGGVVRLRLEIEEATGMVRAPRPTELPQVQLIYVPVSD